MTSPLERAKADWAEKMEAVRVVHCPEWGEPGTPLEIHVPPMNMAQRIKLVGMAQKNDLEAVVESIIIRAKSPDGTAMFSPKDKTILMTDVDPDILATVAKDINADLEITDQDIEAAAGN